MKKLIALAIAAGLLSACATTQATVPVEHPALDVPPVPARVIEPAPLPPVLGPEPVGDLPPISPTTGRPRVPRPENAKGDPKTEPPPAEPVTPPAPVTPTVPPLRTPATPDSSQAAKQIREINARASDMLNTTDYQKLPKEQQAVYQNAKLLINQAEDAIKASNFEFARNLAEKAERLAKELQGRAPQP